MDDREPVLSALFTGFDGDLVPFFLFSIRFAFFELNDGAFGKKRLNGVNAEFSCFLDDE